MLYKVVRRGGSMVVRGEALVHYGTEEFSTAPTWLANQGYHLLVFDSLMVAKNYARAYDGEVWTATCEDEVPLPPICEIRQLRVGHIEDAGSCGLNWWPEATRMFKKVRLIEKVWE